MNSEGHKMVDFNKYCHKCKHRDKKDNESPCDECLDNPTNLYSHQPVKYEARTQYWVEKK